MEENHLTLKTPYVSISDGRRGSYGGSQEWFGRGVLKRYGCGAVALGDVLLYIQHPGGQVLLQREEYLDYIRKLNMRYVHVLPGMGIPGRFLSVAANVYFRVKKMPYRASFCSSGKKLKKRVEKSLSEDLPVMLAVGKNLRFWENRGVALYKRKDGSYVKSSETRGHIVVVTGLLDGYFQVSSWGRKYYISADEYLEYTKDCSSFLIGNICAVKKKKKGKR